MFDDFGNGDVASLVSKDGESFFAELVDARGDRV